MTSKEPTATDEIQGRIETLSRQIEQRLEDAGSYMSSAASATQDADRLTALREGYIHLLRTASSTGATIQINGTVADPQIIARIAERDSRWSRGQR